MVGMTRSKVIPFVFFYLFLSSLFSPFSSAVSLFSFLRGCKKGCYSQDDKKGLGVLVFSFL